MTAPVIAAFLWIIGGSVAGMLPTRDNHWRLARGLMLTGAPLLVWLAVTAGPVAGAVFALAAASLLRWPLILSVRWLWGRVGGRAR